MLLTDALGMELQNKRAMTAFLATKESPYEAKGEARKDELDEQEKMAQDAFNAAADAKREQIETDKASLATDEESLSTTESDIATTTEELTEEKAQLNDNNLYLKDITGQCETKAKEW